MKTLRYLLLISVVIGLTQCKKPEEKNAVQVKAMTELNVPAGFDWQMAHPVNFHITGVANQVIKITANDGATRIHKCGIPAGQTKVDILLSMPDFIKEVQINGVPVQITGPDVYVTLPSMKEFLLTNYCLSFDGVDDVVNLGDVTQLNNVAAFTVEGWAKQTTNTDTETIFYKAADASNDIQLSTNGGTMYVEVGNGSDSYGTWAAYSATITTDTWFHWAIVYDGAGGTDADRLKLYINGNTTPIVLAFTGTIPATTSSSLSAVDAYLSAATSPFGGLMDEVRIWSVARSGAEIAAAYNKIIAGSTTNLVACWRMDENTGTTAYDETSNDYDGTISGCTWTTYANGWDSDGDGVDDLDDDYEMDATRAYDNYSPASDYGTLAFEDIWPNYGDYDFNDLILGYRFKTVTNASNEVVEIYATFVVRANGGNLHNGFGFELPDAVAGILTNVVVTGYSHTQGIITIDGTTKLESGQTNPVIIAFDNDADLMPGICNTVTGGYSANTDSVVIKIEVTGGGPFSANDFSLATWNPFLFIDQTRGRELHELDNTPTDLMTTTYFGTGDDASVPGTGDYYKSSNDLPWVLDFPTSFSWATEYNAINTAYLHFTEWAESGGTTYNTTGVDLWYEITAAGYRNTTYIYVP